MGLLRRRCDGTIWTPAGDSPFPIAGYNFVKAEQKEIGFWIFRIKVWVIDRDKRWCFLDHNLFEIIKG